MDGQQTSPEQHKEYIQYPMIKNNGKDKRKNIYLYVDNNHFAVQKK